MSYVDKEKQRAYQREWLRKRREEWFADKVCEDCGTTDNLELDHVRGKKVDHRIWSWRLERRLIELVKCVARCRECHIERHKRTCHRSSRQVA